MIQQAILSLILAVTPAEICQRHWEESTQRAPSVRYLAFDHVPDAYKVRWHHAIKFAIPSASRATNLDYQVPQRLKGTASYFIDLDHLKWSYQDLNKILEKYPYEFNNPEHPLLVLRGDWLLLQLADPRKSDALYRLLYGGESIPKTDEDFKKFWGVSDDNGQQTGQRYGWVEGNSQVNKNGGRLVERFNARGLSLWRTKDSREITTESDPTEQLLKDFRHDGRELIAQVMKVSPKQGIRCAMQAYLLADANGKVVQEAPPDLVEDFKRVFTQPAIVNHSGCIVCHDQGMKMPSVNTLERILASGVTLHAYSKTQQEEIEEFYLSETGRQLLRDNEDYAKFVKAVNGLTTQQNSVVYKEVLDQYRAPLGRKEAARELGCTEEQLKLALGYASANKIVIGNLLAALAHDEPLTPHKIPRSQWGQDYLKTRELVKVWLGKAAL